MKYVTKKELTPAIVWYILKHNLGKDFDKLGYSILLSSNDCESVGYCIRSNDWTELIEQIKYKQKEYLGEYFFDRYFYSEKTKECEKAQKKNWYEWKRFYKKLLSVILTKIVELENQDLIDRIEDLEIEIKSLKKEIKQMIIELKENQ
jgi:hypothetical protein